MYKSENNLDRLINEFTENYMGKIFYFALKKTGNISEAEDLAQNITLVVITELRKGNIPDNFSAWTWRIARNIYSHWAIKKHKNNERVSGDPIEDLEIMDDSVSPVENIIHNEEMMFLRRELAFCSGEYRNLIVAYYFENKRISEIAADFSLSEETVKKRLQRARKNLKEGMNMAREFGKRSYNPENIHFTSDGSQPSGLPWSAVERMIPKNILMEASNNPSTLEELSVELGIALPYMEEVDILHRATLLEKIGDKYITNFFILDRECRLDIFHALRSASRERSQFIKQFVENNISEIRNLGIIGNHLDNNTMKWWLIPWLTDKFVVESIRRKENGMMNHPKRANGEGWGFIGYELINLPEEIFCGHNGHGEERNTFWAYKFGDYGMLHQCGEITQIQALLLIDCVKCNRNTASFSNNEREIWAQIEGKFAHSDENGNIISDVIVATYDDFKAIKKMVKEFKGYDNFIKNISETYDKIENIFKKYNHKVLHNTMGYYIHMQM